MKQEKLIIVNLVKDLIVKIDQNFINFPNKDIELKRSIKETANSILLDIYIANTSTNLEKRRDLQEGIIAKIKYLDFLVNFIYDKKIINAKKYLKFGEDLEYILKYVNGWKNKENKKIMEVDKQKNNIKIEN